MSSDPPTAECSQQDLRKSIRADFSSRHPFAFDPFQVEAMDAIDDNNSVIVAAPTGSGKTLIAEYATAIAHATGNRVFYTTPLKALSNQKFGDLRRIYGNDAVGLLTGDNVIHGDAPIVVMTTEVLRNMIYVGSSALENLQYVILDEVHYLQNAYRGPVWEEVIIHLPPEIDLVCLSATVSNAEELADWIGTVRGATVAVIEETRPVRLEQHYLVGVKGQNNPVMIPTFTDRGKPNPAGNVYDPAPKRSWQRHARKLRYLTPRRAEVIETLHTESMLPAIYFVFSRNGCDDAVRQCMNAGIRLTSQQERAEIREIRDSRLEDLDDEALRVLNYDDFAHALECGIAPHHAGMIPPFKEIVEACFVRSLVKVVFATETLALGINMPARSVVIEKLTKFTGERHEALTPGEFTQLTGRAGRRGIDSLGHAVVLWSPFHTFAEIASLASTRSYQLTSSFRPTYNMAANLIRRYPPDVAHHLLNLSFAQFRSDIDIVRLEARLDRVMKQLNVARNNAECERGDVEKWRARVSGKDPETKRDTHEFIARAVSHLHIGDVIRDPGTDNVRHVLIVTTANRRGHDTKLGVLTPEGKRFTLTARDFFVAPHRVRHLELPKPFNPGNKEFIKRCAATLKTALPNDDVLFVSRSAAHMARGPGACPDIAVHVQALDEVKRLAHEQEKLTREVKGRTESLARQFDRVLQLLRERAYVEDWQLTTRGVSLANLYHETDLLIVECLEDGVADGLTHAELAAVFSCFTYESRGPIGTRTKPEFPTKELYRRWQRVKQLWETLTQHEAACGLDGTRMPDPEFMKFSYEWSTSDNLAELLEHQEMSGGDFVRNIKQLIDLLRQIGQSDAECAQQARAAADTLHHGVVAAASVGIAAADASDE